MSSAPTAITGTWSDMERRARWLYENMSEGTDAYELAEAVLVLLAADQADLAAARAREQRLARVLADFANPQHWAIDRGYDPPKAVWIGTYSSSPVDHARAAADEPGEQ